MFACKLGNNENGITGYSFPSRWTVGHTEQVIWEKNNRKWGCSIVKKLSWKVPLRFRNQNFLVGTYTYYAEGQGSAFWITTNFFGRFWPSESKSRFRFALAQVVGESEVEEAEILHICTCSLLYFQPKEHQNFLKNVQNCHFNRFKWKNVKNLFWGARANLKREKNGIHIGTLKMSGTIWT
jgi:hypothetical protein